ncbi:MAG: hypothetical protein EXQ49_08770 [Acidobacteria bacterium]|nr:hypothetical protein [Acidobacteriota bacterium]
MAIIEYSPFDFHGKAYELIEEGTQAYLVMEFVEGETLAAILRRGRPPLSQAVQLASEIAEGQAAAHSRGVQSDSHRYTLGPGTELKVRSHTPAPDDSVLSLGARKDLAGRIRSTNWRSALGGSIKGKTLEALRKRAEKMADAVENGDVKNAWLTAGGRPGGR